MFIISFHVASSCYAYQDEKGLKLCRMFGYKSMYCPFVFLSVFDFANFHCNLTEMGKGAIYSD